VRTLVPIVERLRRRFAIGEVCIVADRGMISAQTLEELEKRHWGYILGARLRSQKEVSEEVLSRGGRYQVVFPKGRHTKDPAPLQVKEVVVEDRRYIVCLNEDQRRKEAADREAIVDALRKQLSRGDKSLVGNKGYRKYLKTQGERFAIDEQKISDEARYDGKWVLRTNTDLPTAEVALKYKQLWMVEAIFRSAKSLLETRPIFHKCDDTIRGHVFCSFLALVQGIARAPGRSFRPTRMGPRDRGSRSTGRGRSGPSRQALPLAVCDPRDLRQSISGGGRGPPIHRPPDPGGRSDVG
jgi:transposase